MARFDGASGWGAGAVCGRLMVYRDYTASGRCLACIEGCLQSLQRIYANTHTEDDLTGRRA